MISMIAAVGKNYELGKDNQLIWHIPEDMKFFKDTTLGHIVVMGWNTYKSLPGPLKDRHMVVISKRHEDNSIKIVNDPQEIVNKYYDVEDEIFIIGGASLYKYFLEYAKNLYLTEIDDTCLEADSFFPIFNKNEWEDNILREDTYKDIKYKIHKYTKIK